MPFVVADRWIWVECDKEGYQGARVEVRQNLTNGELQKLRLLLDEVDEKRREIVARSEAQLATLTEAREQEGADRGAIAVQIADLLEAIGKEHTTNSMRVREAITPYVRAWNIGVPNERGEIVDAPPPLVAGLAAFEAVDAVLEGWIVSTLLVAYRAGEGFANSKKKPGELAPRGNGHERETTAVKRRSTRPPVAN